MKIQRFGDATLLFLRKRGNVAPWSIASIAFKIQTSDINLQGLNVPFSQKNSGTMALVSSMFVSPHTRSLTDYQKDF